MRTFYADIADYTGYFADGGGYSGPERACGRGTVMSLDWLNANNTNVWTGDGVVVDPQCRVTIYKDGVFSGQYFWYFAVHDVLEYSSCPANSDDNGTDCTCRTGYRQSTATNSCDVPVIVPVVPAERQICTAGQSVGHPIIPGTGEKVLNELDYSGNGPHALSLQRSYRSSWATGDARNLVVNSGLGQAWSHNHAVSLKLEGPAATSGTQAKVVLGDASVKSFGWNTATLSWDPLNSADSLTSGSPGMVYRRLDDNSVWQFDATGRLLNQTQRNGWVNSYAYSTTSTSSSIAPIAGLLISVSNQFTQTLSFAYDASSQLVRVTTPDSQTVTFQYDGVVGTLIPSRLITVTYPGSLGGTVSKSYLYENSTYPQVVTGIMDESGNRLATYAYDVAGRGISTQYAGGAFLNTVSYGTGTATVTDPLGTQRTYSYGAAMGKLAVTGASLPGSGSTSDAASRTQDANGFVTQETDFLGVQTMYTWDINRRLPLVTTKAAGLTETQVVSTVWHSTMTLPVLVTETGRVTAYTYDGVGNKLTETVMDTSTSVSRTWAWTYNAQGLVSSSINPAGGTTTFAYDTAGNLTTTANAEGHTTTFAYDTGGRVIQTVAPTRLTTTFAYDGRSRVIRQSEGGLTTTIAYTPTGLPGTVTLPTGYRTSYSYDAAQRLTGWTDNRGAQGLYTLDAMGNRLQEQIKDASGAVVWQSAQGINNLNRQVTSTLGTSAATESQRLAYNANADLIAQANGLNQTSTFTLDGLKRITAMTDPLSATARLGYNPLDAVTSAIDYKGVTTTFSRDALGNATRESTPDAGTSTAVYGSLGLVLTALDSMGQPTTVTRDLLGRPMYSYINGKTTTFNYDYASNSHNFGNGTSYGLLGRIKDPVATTNYERDAWGRIYRKTQDLFNGTTQEVTSTFTTKGLPNVITYPSGNKLAHQYDSTGQLGTLTWNGTPLITGITWTPLGQAGTWTWSLANKGGTDFPSRRSFDTAGRMSFTDVGSYGYDAAGRVTSLTQESFWPSDNNPANSGISYGYNTWGINYDATGRLTASVETTTTTGTTVGPGTTTFSYDPNGNRLGSFISTVRSNGGGTTTTSLSTRSYSISPGTNRLQGYSQSTTISISGGGTTTTSTNTISYTYNAAGDITQAGSKTFVYDATGRMTSVASGPTGISPTTYYSYNALGQRVFKTEPITGTHTSADPGFAYVYDEDGNLLGEYGTGGAASTGSTEYIWLKTVDGAKPVATVINGSLYMVTTDGLGTPRRLHNETGATYWQWRYNPFGEEAPTIGHYRFADLSLNPNPGTVSYAGSVTFNLRYPGQYYDVESGLNYNYFRSYDGKTGRYTQADPIGLEGGWNRFGYTDNSPVMLSDRFGLEPNGGRNPGESDQDEVGPVLPSPIPSVFPKKESTVKDLVRCILNGNCRPRPLAPNMCTPTIGIRG